MKLTANTKESPRSRGPAGSPGRDRGFSPGRTAAPLVFLLLFTAGCGSYHSLKLPERPAHTLSNRVERKGLMVAARGYLEPGVAARYFTAGLWEAGYFPVVFHFENRGMGTFEVERTRITIRRERGGAVDAPKAAEPLAPRPVAEILERCRRSSSPAYLLAPLFIFPAVWARGEIERYNFELVKDLEGKALPGYYRLEPESPPLRGAVFFSRPEGEPLVELLKGAELRLDVMIEGSRMPASEKSDTPGAEPDETRVGETLTFILPLTSVGE